jgi:cytochrome c biogenesis protein ResB
MQAHGNDGAALPLSLRFESQAAADAERLAGPIKDYKSTLQIIVNGKLVKEKTIEVNAPLAYGGYTFYQSGYDPRDPSWTSLQVVRDPGVLIVYAGFVLMMVGLTVVFWLAPAAESSQRKAGVSS